LGVCIKAHKQNNIRNVLGQIRKHDVFAVAELSREVRLSKTTVKKTIDLLTAMNLVVSAGKGESTEEGGKRPELYRFNSGAGYVISLHVTPDALIAVVADLSVAITLERKIPIGADRELDQVLDLLAGTVRELVAAKAESGAKLIAIALALPGLADATRGISLYSPHYPGWGRDVPIEEPLRRRLGGVLRVPIFIDCVNRFQAVAEREKGAAGGADNFIIIDALDEGLGSGIMTHGELVHGSQGLSGEIGHMTLNPVDGSPCICGHRGCFEAMVSVKRLRGLAEEARAHGERSTLFTPAIPSGITLDRICAEAARGDALCTALLEDAARWFIVGLGNVIMVNDPELIIIQGQYLKAGPWFLAKLREGIRSIGLPDVEKRVRIEYSTLGEERGVIGGAAFAVADWFSRRLVFAVP
jgi:N-acetylglucosamine repressor